METPVSIYLKKEPSLLCSFSEKIAMESNGKATLKQRQEAERRVKCILTKCKKIGVQDFELTKFLTKKNMNVSKNKQLSTKKYVAIVTIILGISSYFYAGSHRKDRVSHTFYLSHFHLI